VASKPQTIIDLTWLGDLKFAATSGDATITLDSAGSAGPSPVQTLGFALAGCMAMDVAHILTRSRHVFRTLTAHLVADRAEDDPRRILRVTIRFTVEGNVPAEAVARALALSRETYCSVWHSMRQDIELVTSTEIMGTGTGGQEPL